MPTYTDSQLPDGIQVLERGWLSSNNILIIGQESSALVDSGYATHAAQTLALVERALGSRSLDLLVNTHLHSDHCGGNATLRERFAHLTVAIPPGEAQAVRDWDESRLSFQSTGQQCPRFNYDRLLMPGTNVDLGGLDWEGHAAPGHDPHAVTLFDPQSKTLISGDALWERAFGVVFPEMWGEPSFDQVADTLDVIESLGPRSVIPGHGRVFHEVHIALTAARQRLSAFVASPSRHARHAVKVLLKFKLLEQHRMSREAMAQWLAGAGYLEQVWERYGGGSPMLEWAEELLGELVQAGAATIEGEEIVNAG